MEDKILLKLPEDLLPVVNMTTLSDEQYGLVRKNTFGASDSSILCGVNIYTTMDTLMIQKNSKFLTDAEKEIGKKPAVRKGRDLEPLILRKYTESTGNELIKPTQMYVSKEFPDLSINYDGLTIIKNELIPIEAKYVTQYGEKYYKKNVNQTLVQNMHVSKHGNLQEHIKYWADTCGIPAYYYTQVQQQIWGAAAPYGMLTVLFEKSWDNINYYIPRDNYVISNIIAIASKRGEKMVKKNLDYVDYNFESTRE